MRTIPLRRYRRCCSSRWSPPVLSKRSLVRYGDDIMAIWDAENPASDIIMGCALTAAKALSTRARLYRATQLSRINYFCRTHCLNEEVTHVE